MSERIVYPEIVAEVRDLVFAEFLDQEGNRTQDEVAQILEGYSALSEFAGLQEEQEVSEFGAWFIATVTHVGNNARLGLQPNSSEPLFDRARRLVEPDKHSYEEQSKTEFAITFPNVIQAIVNHPELEQPAEILENLKDEGVIKNHAYKYNLMLIRQIKTLSDAIAFDVE